MSNIIDYILWRGDLEFEVSEFNEVDNLILSKLSYLNFYGIVCEEDEIGISISKASKISFKDKKIFRRILFHQCIYIVKYM
jgi:hypothetical protein